ncbi:ADP-ribosylglycohydrolase [Streptomyces puniciscabiei]|uniref:ADP-ribosylglycohydrolase n=1 Tax=Streptomyces puniciscabiei TaxID=164348 RepID=A0A542UHW1_9ACTN|nr:ADP-ribosylglycohydrolase [Streptomyces puniciscabiei]
MSGPGILERAAGAVLGSAVGDALGAPFEFGPEGAFSARFPRPGHGGEMCGGGGRLRRRGRANRAGATGRGAPHPVGTGDRNAPSPSRGTPPRPAHPAVTAP